MSERKTLFADIIIPIAVKNEFTYRVPFEMNDLIQAGMRVVIPFGKDDLNRINNSTRVISVLMPNDNTASTDWKQFRTSVDDIETQTGYDILSNVTTGIQTIIESRVDTL